MTRLRFDEIHDLFVGGVFGGVRSWTELEGFFGFFSNILFDFRRSIGVSNIHARWWSVVILD